MAVKCVRLITGEEIIAEVTELVHEAGITVVKPANIFLQPDGKGRVTVSLMPLFAYAEKPEFIFPQSAIMVIFNPSADMQNEYSRLFGSGLLIPSINSGTAELIRG